MKLDKYINAESQRLISVLLGKQMADRWIAQEKILDKQDNILRVANTGLVNSGKSSLFNALTDHIDKERFPTGAARTTVREDAEMLAEGIYIVDTPGIDATSSDDEKANQAVLSADIILIVHNIKLGAPNRAEMEWFKNICDYFPEAQERKDRIMFICSWIDERDGEEGYSELIRKTKEMVTAAAGIELDFFELSAKRYLLGKQKNKGALVDKSNVAMFKMNLFVKCGMVMSKYQNSGKDKALELCSDTINQLKHLKTQKESTKKSKENEIWRKNYQPKLEYWSSLKSKILSLAKKYLSRKKELDNI